ncbi:uncharacterized protein LOC125714605 [Brienomyrus brachyistius]|uniref:uncharacterized protein LOC125714605 n=1 Tax=Brienomyrus brachyistius TaxID=42636 RepID=UPI0020B4435C|nr:uncharacterized protein LOC125714605 [Brienomyrus brachyistius]
MDNQEHRPNWLNQIYHILVYICYGELLLLDCLFPGLSFLLRELYKILTYSNSSSSSASVKVHMQVAGETFQAHETFIQKLSLQIELCSEESCSVILVFCTVASRIGTDMEAAMAKVTEDKPVILVFMHHCHDPSHMTNVTVEPCSSKIVQTVQCAFHESQGLLECTKNGQAVAEVRFKLLQYKCYTGEERIKINSVRPFSYNQF